jgi:hypothetical protein
VLEAIKCAVDEYRIKFRHPQLPDLELSALYALFPDEKEFSHEAELHWPESYPNAARQGVYLIFGGSGRLLYIGKASMNSSMGGRLAHWFHYDTSWRGCRVVHPGWSERPAYLATIAVPRDMGFEAPALEEYLIKRLNPLDNAIGGGPQKAD